MISCLVISCLVISCLKGFHLLSHLELIGGSILRSSTRPTHDHPVKMIFAIWLFGDALYLHHLLGFNRHYVNHSVLLDRDIRFN